MALIGFKNNNVNFYGLRLMTPIYNVL